MITRPSPSFLIVGCIKLEIKILRNRSRKDIAEREWNWTGIRSGHHCTCGIYIECFSVLIVKWFGDSCFTLLLPVAAKLLFLKFRSSFKWMFACFCVFDILWILWISNLCHHEQPTLGLPIVILHYAGHVSFSRCIQLYAGEETNMCCHFVQLLTVNT